VSEAPDRTSDEGGRVPPSTYRTRMLRHPDPRPAAAAQGTRQSRKEKCEGVKASPRRRGVAAPLRGNALSRAPSLRLAMSLPRRFICLAGSTSSRGEPEPDHGFTGSSPSGTPGSWRSAPTPRVHTVKLRRTGCGGVSSCRTRRRTADRLRTLGRHECQRAAPERMALGSRS